ncbi:RAMP superfamily CRISPR-associated protein [Actinomadura algeriensis]|uniref:CRISPR-associated protein Csx10 n=1 Tax=Actinomadura algeriensis TaxID=1679523 RepID=A0ABR9JTT2_9ACTN|nr:RAMP superfamily CRISPR-associated protein [Actinomadura algeriensis]MBE1533974.1 CRISPR-associated protein Csx10 [Actinomadura algeriensis]
MGTTIDLTVHMLSDWHIGTGTGRHGQLNARVLRDDDGLPYLPAKTVNGVWRDACEVAARALDGGDLGPWHRRVEYVFGSQPAHPGAEARSLPDARVEHPRSAALRFLGPFRFPAGLGAALRADLRLQEAVTFVKPGVAHDRVSGAAQENMLRFDEMARGGVALAGRVELPDGLPGDELNRVRTLLYLGARLVEGVGANRRRGSGRCRFELGWEPPGEEELDAWTASSEEPPEPEPPDGPDGGDGAAVDGEWERVPLRITLQAPLIAHHRTVGNLVQGRDHIPGWMMLREVLRRLDGPAAAALRRGDLVVTDATPVVDGRPGRPVPRVLERGKDDPDVLVNRMRAMSEAATKRLRDGYISGAGNAVAVHRPKFEMRMHNTIEDTVQRPTEDLGGVYVYRALAAGTVLAGEVRVRAGILPGGWGEALAGTWRLGRSRKDDYGIVQVDLGEPDGTPPGNPAGTTLRVWLMSDVQVRNERLAPSNAPKDLARALGDALEKAGAGRVVLDPVEGDAELVPNRYETARTESWHTGWRLPRPVLPGFAAGGCLTFEIAEGTVTPEAIAAVELAGVGDRRGEGFGQVRINDPFLERDDLEAADQPDDDARPAGKAEPLEPSSRGHDAARVIERAAWRAEIRRASERAAAEPDGRVLGGLAGLTSTRLNNLRGLFPHLAEDGATLKRRIRRLTRDWGDTAGKAVENVLVETEPWELLDIDGLDRLSLTTDGVDRCRAELRAEARRSMIAACLAVRTRREAREEGA